MYDVIIGYVVGTIASIVLFHQFIKEHIITAALDSLIEQGYLRCYVDEEGITQLMKPHEMTPEEVARGLDRVREMIEEYEEGLEKDEKDDSP